MINARSIATLGIGFGVVAISTLGVLRVVVLPDVVFPNAIKWNISFVCVRANVACGYSGR